MNIRPAHLSDIESIAALHAASWRNAYRGALSDAYLAGDIQSDRLALWESRLRIPRANQHVVVAVEGQDLFGFACVNIADDPEWGSLLDNLHVAQHAHRRGIGTILLTAAARFSANAAADGGMYLWVLQNNSNAQAFYFLRGASNVGSDIWDAPGGTQVPRYRFAWPGSALPLGGS